MTWLRRNVFEVLDVLKFVGILLLVLMFIHFNTVVANQAQETQTIASSTNRVVKSQGDILKAIKQVTTDGNLNSGQQTAIIICMLQVPVENRTTDLQAQCRKQATLTSSTPTTPSAVAPSVSQPSSTVSVSSSPPQSAPSNPKAQATTPQPSGNSGQPAPKPGLIQRVINNVKGLL